MHWFLFALAAPFLWSVSNHTDKFLLGKYYQNIRAGTLMFLTALSSLIFALLILAFKPGVIHLPLGSIVLLMIAGVVYFSALFPYLYALNKDETSRVVPLFQVMPIFAYVLAFIFLHEHLDIHQIIAGLVIICGAMLISADIDNGLKIKKAVFFLMMLSTLLFGLEALIFKYVAVDFGFWQGSFYLYIGAFLAGLALFGLSKGFRDDFIGLLKKSGKPVFSLSLINEAVNIAARACFNYAILLAPLALVTLVNGFQPFFTFAIGIILTLFLPHLGEESLLHKHLVQKIISITIIFSGTYILFK